MIKPRSQLEISDICKTENKSLNQWEKSIIIIFRENVEKHWTTTLIYNYSILQPSQRTTKKNVAYELVLIAAAFMNFLKCGRIFSRILYKQLEIFTIY